jgi:hypothetical protein
MKQRGDFQSNKGEHSFITCSPAILWGPVPNYANIGEHSEPNLGGGVLNLSAPTSLASRLYIAHSSVYMEGP